MTGLVALHGGAEYVAGDEPAMDALVAAAVDAAAARGDDRPRVVVLPTAAAPYRPDLAVADATRAFKAAATRAGVRVSVAAAMVVDPASAADPAQAERLSSADLVHLPGGDPDLVVATLAGSRAWEALVAAHARGACLAGASAGGMALCERTWTRGGAIDALGLLPGVAVVPHFDPRRLGAWRGNFPAGLTWIGLDEQTLVIGRPGADAWAVAGAGRAHLIPPGAVRAVASAGHGETLALRA